MQRNVAGIDHRRPGILVRQHCRRRRSTDLRHGFFRAFLHELPALQPAGETFERKAGRELVIVREPALRREVEDEVFDARAHR